MLLIHKETPIMPLTELENDLESVWAKVFANTTSQDDIEHPVPRAKTFSFFDISLSTLSLNIRNFLWSTYYM